MNNEGLSAKVAEARGEKCDYYGKVLFYTDKINPDNGNIILHPNPKPYATDMNAAKELLETMKERWWREIVITVKMDGVSIYISNTPNYADASTLERAICKLFLKFKGVKG